MVINSSTKLQVVLQTRLMNRLTTFLKARALFTLALLTLFASSARAEDAATSAQREIGEILDRMRAQSPSPSAPYVDLLSGNLYQRILRPEGGWQSPATYVTVILDSTPDGVLTTQIDESQGMVVYADAVLNDSFLTQLKDSNLFTGGRRAPISSERLRDMSRYAEKFGSWEKIAKESPTPAFIKLFDGRNVADYEEGVSLAQDEGCDLTGFCWDGQSAKVVTFVRLPKSVYEVSSENYHLYSQLADVLDSLRSDIPRHVQATAKNTEARRREIDQRFR